LVGDKRISVAAVIRDDEGRILLVKQTYGHLNWELPGGNVEVNAEVTAAVVREVQEETGLDVAADRVAGLYDEQDENFLHLVFACHCVEPGAALRPDLDEVSACAYWPPDAPPRPISGYTIRRIRDALAVTNGTLPLVIHERQWLE